MAAGTLTRRCYTGHRTGHRTGGRPRGAALVTGLVLLAVMTLTALNAVRGSLLEERLTGNLRDRATALQAAEAGLQAALAAIESSRRPPGTDAFGGAALHPGCGMDDRACTLMDEVLADWRSGEAPTLGATLSDFGGSPLADRAGVHQPRVVIEVRYVGLGEQEHFEAAVRGAGVYLYTVTALGIGSSGETRAIVQSTIPKVFDW